MFWVLKILIGAVALTCGIIVNDPMKEYEFSYDIDDPFTGDHTAQKEIKKGDSLAGRYSIQDSRGVKQTIYYTTDKHNGFQVLFTQDPTPPSMYNPTTQTYSSHRPHGNYYGFVPILAMLCPDCPEKAHEIDHSEIESSYGKYFTPAYELQSHKTPIDGIYFEPNN